jgi:hypothetical protein
VPFSELLPINKDTIMQFVADYISGKLRSPEDAEEMAKKQLTTISLKNQWGKAQRCRLLHGILEVEYRDLSVCSLS